MVLDDFAVLHDLNHLVDIEQPFRHLAPCATRHGDPSAVRAGQPLRVLGRCSATAFDSPTASAAMAITLVFPSERQGEAPGGVPALPGFSVPGSAGTCWLLPTMNASAGLRFRGLRHDLRLVDFHQGYSDC
jgi:hypothetical protein